MYKPIITALRSVLAYVHKSDHELMAPTDLKFISDILARMENRQFKWERTNGKVT